MKSWTLIDWTKVKELLDAYDGCQRLANQFRMFDSYNIIMAMSDIREAIRLEVDGKPVVEVKAK